MTARRRAARTAPDFPFKWRNADMRKRIEASLIDAKLRSC